LKVSEIVDERRDITNLLEDEKTVIRLQSERYEGARYLVSTVDICN
jgi:hypothetical protein